MIGDPNRQTETSTLYIYRAIKRENNLCFISDLYMCGSPNITHEPLVQFASNFDFLDYY